jgi:predicted RNA methylase
VVQGSISVLSWWRKKVYENIFDAIHHVDTVSTTLAKGSLGIDSEFAAYGIAYDASPWRVLPKLLELAGISCCRELAFIDVGCGKGKVLLSAMQYPFSAVYGIDYSTKLCEIAKRNLARARWIRHHCQRVAVLCEDATRYKFPLNPGVIFFYNPFGYPVMRQVLHRIKESYLEAPRQIYLVFYACSSSINQIKEFLHTTMRTTSQQRASGVIGRRSVYVFELSPHLHASQADLSAT